MKKIVLTFGLVSGAVITGSMLASMPFHDVLGNSRALLLGYTTLVLGFLLIYFGVRSYRDQVAGGHIGFGRALGVGLLIGLVASTCYVAAWEVAYFGGKSDYLEKYQAREIENARRNGGSEAVIAAKAAEMKKIAEMYRNPVFNAAITFTEPMPVALVVSLVTAGILGRRRKGAAPAA